MNHNDPIGLNAFFTDILIANRVFTFHNHNQYGGDGLEPHIKQHTQPPMTCGFAGGLLSFFTCPQKYPFPSLPLTFSLMRRDVVMDIVKRANRLATDNINSGSTPDRGIDGDSPHFPYNASYSTTVPITLPTINAWRYNGRDIVGRDVNRFTDNILPGSIPDRHIDGDNYCSPIPITLPTRGRGGLNAKAENFFAIRMHQNPILFPAPAYPLSFLCGVGRCNEFEELSSAMDNSTDLISIIHRGTGRFKSFFRGLGTSTLSYLNCGGNGFNKNNKTKQIVNASTTLTWAMSVPVFTFYSTVGSVVVSSGLVRYGSVRHGKVG